MTKPVILNPNNQKVNKTQNIVGFGSKVIKFCLRIKTFPQMLEKQVSFAKIREGLVKKLTSDLLIFKIVLKD